MSDFVPPYPTRPSRPLSALALLRALTRNFVAVWPKIAFDYEFFSTRLLSRRVFICNSPDTVNYAFVSHNAQFERKSPQMRHALKPLLGDGLFISDGETWRARRRVVAPIVHVSRLPLFAPIMVEVAAEAAERWARLPAGAPIDALSEMAELTAEIICRTIFGRRLGGDHAKAVVRSFSAYQRKIGQMDFLSLIGLPDWLPRLYGLSIRRSARRIHRILDEIIESYRARPRDSEASVIGLLLDARDPETGEALDPEALRSEAAVIFMAGHETTANSLAWTWYLLSQAPDVEARLHDELAVVLGGRLPTLDDVPRLVYTRAVFEETLRLYPPVPILSRQALSDEVIRGRKIKAGSLLLVVPWLLHRHKRIWDKPDHFMPERFLPGNAAARPKGAYVPFSTGPRICAGAAFGLTEAVLCLATLAQRFRLRLQPGAAVQPVCRLTLRPGKRLPMTVHSYGAVLGAAAQ
ncbi:MAG TPA: cytochrome P450 [Candidatus Sulfotelmatobacter sp.]|nr:cytochrome P450 [Candidatus Sulfotelmatobacter sp.]